jgi:hypothetical protein
MLKGVQLKRIFLGFGVAVELAALVSRRKVDFVDAAFLGSYCLDGDIL